MDSGVAREACCPLVACERLALALVRREEWWCVAKNNKAPQNFDSISRYRHFERSREIFLVQRLSRLVPPAHILKYFSFPVTKNSSIPCLP